ncbi:MAG: NUDIX hydrolase [Acidobacteriaceae bacterium]
MKREYPEAPIVGIGAVVLDGSRVLLVRRGKEPLKGEWALPGGALELGETLVEGVIREVREETGLDIKPEALVEVFDRIYRNENGEVQYHYVLVDWLCRFTGGELRCGDDADDARWVDHTELGSHGIYKLAPFTIAVIEKAFRMTMEQGNS